MNPILKAMVWILAVIIGLAALITSVIYDWSNIEPGESNPSQSSGRTSVAL